MKNQNSNLGQSEQLLLPFFLKRLQHFGFLEQELKSMVL